MRDLSSRVDEARAAVRLDWTPERAAAVERAMVRRGRRRRQVRTGLAVLALLLFAVVGLRRGVFGPATTVSNNLASAWETLPDGSRIARRTRDTRYEYRAEGADVVVRLVRGSASFDVVHRVERVFRVEAGSAAVLVLGTRFTVTRLEDRVRVSVDSGRVRVVDAARSADLAPGESLEVPLGDDAHRAPEVATTAEEPVPTPVAPSHPSVHTGGATPRAVHEPSSAEASPEWRTLARAGEYDRAYAALGTPSSRSVQDDPADLLLAADSARLSHHPAEALPYLRGVLDRHPEDPRAPLAAFALGRVLLDELGDPRAAAGAFARAEQLDPSGSLAEDALARQVEALSRAGESDAAHTTALRYLERFPSGRRLAAVRRFGGIEP